MVFSVISFISLKHAISAGNFLNEVFSHRSPFASATSPQSTPQHLSPFPQYGLAANRLIYSAFRRYLLLNVDTCMGSSSSLTSLRHYIVGSHKFYAETQAFEFFVHRRFAHAEGRFTIRRNGTPRGDHTLRGGSRIEFRGTLSMFGGL